MSFLPETASVPDPDPDTGSGVPAEVIGQPAED